MAIAARNLVIAFSLVATLVGCKKEQPSTSPASPAAPASGPASTSQLRIAAASDLQFALADLLKSFESQHPEIHVIVTYGSSGNFFSQLSNKAPFDVFLSADATYPQKLVDQGLAQPSALFPYATGRIALWAPKESPLNIATQGLTALTDPRVKKIAIANPDHAPYGRAAVGAMKSANIYDRVKDHLVLGENISQTAQFVSTGSADIGIIALSLALAPQMSDKGTYWEIPTNSYPPIEQAGVIMNTATDPQAAQAFRDYLTSDPGRSALARFGFSPPSR
jgi:molybdate transport system substrate-binding protein